MRARQKVSRAGIELIAGFEGLRRRAARLPDGRWTIGYGHTLSAREGSEVSAEDAVALLHFDLLPIVEAVNSLVYTPLNDNQFDALVAFAYNVGVDAFRTSDVLKRVNEGRLTEAACAIDLWRKADIGGDAIILDALIRRRAAEKALFLTPPDGFVPTPSPLVRPLVDESLAPALPASRPAEIAVPMDGDQAEVHRLDAPEPVNLVEPEPEPQGRPAPELSDEPVEVTVSEVAPAEAMPQDAVPTPVAYSDEIPVATPEELAVQALETGEPGADAIAPLAEETAPEATAPAEAEPAPEEAGGVEASAIVHPFPTAPSAAPAVEQVAAETLGEPAAPEPAFPAGPAALEPQPLQAVADAEPRSFESVAAAAATARLYAPEEVAQAAPVMPAFAPEPSGDFSSQPAEVSPASMLGAAVPAPIAAPADLPAAEPVLTTQSEAPASVWTLTPPPEIREEELTVVYEPTREDLDESQSRLFDDGGASLGLDRVVRYEDIEPVADAEAEADRPSSGPFILMGLIGFAAFGGAVSAFLKGRSGSGADELTVIAWVLALIGVACVGTAVYFLLGRLSGAED